MPPTVTGCCTVFTTVSRNLKSRLFQHGTLNKSRFIAYPNYKMLTPKYMCMFPISTRKHVNQGEISTERLKADHLQAKGHLLQSWEEWNRPVRITSKNKNGSEAQSARQYTAPWGPVTTSLKRFPRPILSIWMATTTSTHPFWFSGIEFRPRTRGRIRMHHWHLIPLMKYT